jgi:hypothetical protein
MISYSLTRSLILRFLHIVFVVLILVACSCSDPLGFPAYFRVYSDDDYSELLQDSNYSQAVSVTGIQAIKQEVTCGYAVIEMLAKWKGKPITEKTLLSQNNGKISTSMGSGFLKEMNRQETYTVHDFIRATRYECYENMEWYFKISFNIGLFHKNTIYIIGNK